MNFEFLGGEHEKKIIQKMVANEKDIIEIFGSTEQFKDYLSSVIRPTVKDSVEQMFVTGKEIEPSIWVYCRDGEQVVLSPMFIRSMMNSEIDRLRVPYAIRYFLLDIFHKKKHPNLKIVATHFVSETWFTTKNTADVKLRGMRVPSEDPERIDSAIIMEDSPLGGHPMLYEINRRNKPATLSEFKIGPDVLMTMIGENIGNELMNKVGGTYVSQRGDSGFVFRN